MLETRKILCDSYRISTRPRYHLFWVASWLPRLRGLKSRWKPLPLLCWLVPAKPYYTHSPVLLVCTLQRAILQRYCQQLKAENAAKRQSVARLARSNIKQAVKDKSPADFSVWKVCSRFEWLIHQDLTRLENKNFKTQFFSETGQTVNACTAKFNTS